MTGLQMIERRGHFMGQLPVDRILPAKERQMLGPFIFMDHGGPATLPRVPGAGVPEHPHAGLSTFTYLMDGAVAHRDSAGHAAVIRPGDIALMTAGSGITHEEMAYHEGTATHDTAHFVQMWIALPDALEETAPAFEHHASAALPTVQRKGATVRLAMGSAWGATAPTTCHSTTLFADVNVAAGGSLAVPALVDELGVLLLSGDLSVDGQALASGPLYVLPAKTVSVTSGSGGRAILLGGAHFPSKRWIAGSFVASSPQKLSSWMRASRTSAWPRIARR